MVDAVWCDGRFCPWVVALVVSASPGVVSRVAVRGGLVVGVGYWWLPTERLLFAGLSVGVLDGPFVWSVVSAVGGGVCWVRRHRV